MPAAPGTEIELEMPGTTVQGMPTSARAWSSSMPRPKTYGSPPLSRTTALPALACSIRALLMASWAMNRPYGIFAASMTSTCGELVEQVAGAEPVRDDHVGLGEQAAAAHGDQVGVARPAADEGDAGGGAVAVAGGGEGPLAQAFDDRVADGGGAARVVAGQDGDGDALDAAGGRGPGGGGGGVVGADAPDALAFGLGGGALVVLAVLGGDQGIPGAGEVAVPVAAALPADLARLRHRVHRGRRRRGDQQDVRAGRDERGQAALGDLSAADDDDTAAGRAESYGVGGGVGHGGCGSWRRRVLWVPLRRWSGGYSGY